MGETAIAVDIGGTKMAAALIDSSGRQLSEKIKALTPSHSGREAILDTLASLIEREYELLDETALAGIGIGAAGAIDTARGMVVHSSGTILDWVGTDIAQGLRERLAWAEKVPIHVLNDANAHAVGESWMGAGAGASSMLMVAVGTGVGCAFCIDGVVLEGAHHMAGEIGMARISFADEPHINDGNLPAKFEQNSAGPAMVEFYQQAHGAAANDPARRQFVMELAAEGDPVALDVTHAFGRRLGEVVSWYVMMLDPEVIVLGGGVPKVGSAWWDAMETRLRELLPAYLEESLDLRRAQLENNAALLGAAREAFRRAGVTVSSYASGVA